MVAGDLGHAISYVALEKRTPVFSSDGHQIGTVGQVLIVHAKDVFDGIVVSRGVGKRPLFADADDVERIYERGVVLKVSASESEKLPEPYTGGYARLKRVWNTISGKR